MELGDIALYFKKEYVISGWYKHYRPSYDQGYELICPCVAEEAEFVKIGTANILTKNEVVVTTPKFLKSVDTSGIKQNHQEELDNFLQADEDCKISYCFKIKENLL